MTYLISDIHADLTGFKKILNRISFNENTDHLINLGDLLDRGSFGIVPLLNYIEPFITNGSMTLLLGNHEYFAHLYINGSLSSSLFSAFGGRRTIEDIDRMTADEKAKMDKFIMSLPLYYEIDSSTLGPTILTHSGLHRDYLIVRNGNIIDTRASIETGYEKDPYGFLCGNDIHFLDSTRCTLDKYMIVGHVPVNRLLRGNCCDFFRTPCYMDIDTGNNNGGFLSCYCVESDKMIIND